MAIRIDLEEAYRRMTHPHPHSSLEFRSKLSLTTKRYIEQMRLALEAGDAATALRTAKRLENESKKLKDEFEVAEVLVECGRVAFQLEHYSDAVQLLDRAVKQYHALLHIDYIYSQVMAQWMRGYVLWSIPARQEEWLSAWRDSLDKFDTLTHKKATPGTSMAWYKRERSEMEEDINCAIDDDCSCSDPSSPSEADETPPVDEPDDPSPRSPDVKNSIRPVLRLFPVSDEIPAGGFGPTGVDPAPRGHIDIDHVHIDGAPYCIVGIHSEGIVNLPVVGHYVVLKVYGDSMNLAGIDDGDYVLLRPQNVADHNDIVAAEIVDSDSKATLKRMIIRKDKVILQPESTNKAHQDWEFSPFGQGFQVRGVVLAVFKPQPEE